MDANLVKEASVAAGSFLVGAAFRHIVPLIQTKGALWAAKKSFQWEKQRLEAMGCTPEQVKAGLEALADIMVAFANAEKAQADALPDDSASAPTKP